MMLLASYEQTEVLLPRFKFDFIVYENPAIFLFRLQCSNSTVVKNLKEGQNETLVKKAKSEPTIAYLLTLRPEKTLQ